MHLPISSTLTGPWVVEQYIVNYQTRPILTCELFGTGFYIVATFDADQFLSCRVTLTPFDDVQALLNS